MKLEEVADKSRGRVPAGSRGSRVHVSGDARPMTRQNTMTAANVAAPVPNSNKAAPKALKDMTLERQLAAVEAHAKGWAAFSMDKIEATVKIHGEATKLMKETKA